MSQVVAQLFQMRLKMKNLMGSMQGGSGPELSNIEEALKSEQVVFCFSPYVLIVCAFIRV